MQVHFEPGSKPAAAPISSNPQLQGEADFTCAPKAGGAGRSPTRSTRASRSRSARPSGASAQEIARLRGNSNHQVDGRPPEFNGAIHGVGSVVVAICAGGSDGLQI